MKKFFSVLFSAVIIFCICSLSFVSFAVVPDVYLPFPEPLAFGGSDSGSVVWHGVNASNVEIYYMVTVIPSSYNAGGTNGGCHWSFTGKANSMKVDIQGQSNVITGISIYLFSWKPTSGTFNCSLKSSFVLLEGATNSTNIFSNSSYTFDNFLTYGKNVGSSFSDTSIKPSYIFNGQVSQNDVDRIVSHCSGINSSLTSINSNTSDIKSYVNSIMSTTGDIKTKVSIINDTLSNIQGDITFYSNEIISRLDKLLELQGYSEPSETTTNKTASEYESAENALHKDSFDKLENFSVTDFNNASASLGSKFVNAISFLSANMEFLSGNSSYNLSNDNTLNTQLNDSMSKVSTLIFIILTIGVISFVLNLVSSKGD